MNENFDLLFYLIERAIKSPYSWDVYNLFRYTTQKERASMQKEMTVLLDKYKARNPSSFDFTIEDPEFEQLFLKKLKVLYPPTVCGTYDDDFHDPEFFLALAKRRAQERISPLSDHFSEEEQASFRVHVDAINDLFPNIKRQKTE